MLAELRFGSIVAVDGGNGDVEVDPLLAVFGRNLVAVNDDEAGVTEREWNMDGLTGRNALDLALFHRAKELDDGKLRDARRAERRGHHRFADRSLHRIDERREIRVLKCMRHRRRTVRDAES